MSLTKRLSAFQPYVDRLPLPPSYDQWEGKGQRFGYLDCLSVGEESPIGFNLGKIIESTFQDVWEIRGQTQGFKINKNGNLIKTVGFIKSGTRYIQFIKNNKYATTLPVVVYSDKDQTLFFSDTGNDKNDGLQPHKPKKTLTTTNLICCLERGSKFTGRIKLKDNQTIRSWGSPHKASPLIQGFVSADKVKNVTVKDINVDARGKFRHPMAFTKVKNLNVFRCTVKNNEHHKNSAGLRLDNTSGTATVLFFKTVNIDGDGIYGVGVEHANISWAKLSSPTGRAADNIQFTHEGNDKLRCKNVKICHCLCLQDERSPSTKGAIVLEGVNQYLIEKNVVEGKYFGIGVSGGVGEIRNNVVRRGGLHNGQDTWGIGVTPDKKLTKVKILNNEIHGNKVIKHGILLRNIPKTQYVIRNNKIHKTRHKTTIKN